jgi:RNA polymerase sigma factor (sigma-70 family)
LEIQKVSVVNVSGYKKQGDYELVGMCLKGDALAWEALVLRYKRLIYSIPVKFGFSLTDAADVFQSVLLKLLEHLHEVKDERKISSWIATTTTRQCIHLKAMRHRESDPEEQEVEEPLDPTDNMEEIRILTEQLQAVREAVEQLPDRCKSLIEALYLDPEQRSYDEISQALSMPVPSIGPTRARCLEKLKAILRRWGINK